MTARRLRPLLLGAALAVAAAVAAISLNVVLLGRTANPNDPVGRLTQRVHPPAAPAWTLRPSTGPIEDRVADD